MHWRSVLVGLSALPLVACLETDLSVKADGSATGTLTWNVRRDATEASARAAITGDGVTVKRLELKEADVPAAEPGAPAIKMRRAVAEIEAKSLTALAGVPLFKMLSVTATLAEPVDGKRKLTIAAANKNKFDPPKPATNNVVRLHFPGQVAETTATKNGKDVTWTFPTSDYFSKPGVELSAVYATEDTPPSGS